MLQQSRAPLRSDFRRARGVSLQNDFGRKVADAIIPHLPFVMKYYGCVDSVREKADRTLLSHDDIVEQRLQKSLARIFPSAKFLCEETAPKSKRGQIGLFESSLLISIDPIDGTQNYIKGFPFFSVSVGIFESVRNRLLPIAGAVALPALNVLYFTDIDGVKVKELPCGKINIVPPRVEPVDRRNIFTFTSGSRLLARPDRPSDTMHIGSELPAARIVGATSADILYTGLGVFAGTITSAHMWDFAGSLAIARALGVNFWKLSSGELVNTFGPDDFIIGSGTSKDLELAERHLVCAQENVRGLRAILKPATTLNQVPRGTT